MFLVAIIFNKIQHGKSIIIKRKINKRDKGGDFQGILDNGDNIPNINHNYNNDENPSTQKLITIKILRKLFIIFLIIIA